MKQTVTFNDFYNAFQRVRPDNFSYDGLQVLYDFLEEVDPDMELDVIALCCDFSEDTIDTVMEDCGFEYNSEMDFDDKLEFLGGQTTVLVANPEKEMIVYQQF